MANSAMVGGGMVGRCGALLCRRDGHDLTVLEQDPPPPPAPEQAWDGWARRGVTQFRQPHSILARFTATATAAK